MAENTLNRFKRKMRGSSSSDNESLSPQEKKQNSCKSAEDTASDVTKVLSKLDEVLIKLDEMDRKVEGVLENIKGLENAIKSVHQMGKKKPGVPRPIIANFSGIPTVNVFLRGRWR